nr:MAG TPA: hypothetical protein [Caudoviricetes sp.]
MLLKQIPPHTIYSTHYTKTNLNFTQHLTSL